MQNLETLRKTPISEEELNWFRASGGAGEGIILTTSALIDPLFERQAVYFPTKSGEHYLSTRCQIDAKIVPNSGLLHGQSLLAESDIKENWPRFLTAGKRFGESLVGLHLNDFRGIGPLGRHRSLYYQEVLAAGFYLIDILTIERQAGREEREIVVETTSGGLRMVKVAEDWQGRLKKARPFRFRNWYGVFDVIEES